MAKYIVFVDYVATKIIGEVEADSKEEAVAKLRNQADDYISLCTQCEEEFIDGLRMPDGGMYAEKA